MATRSRIGIINKGEVVADTVYCHWDGGRYVAQILKLYYTDVDKIKELISGGDLSSISKFILGAGDRHEKFLWAGNVKDHIKTMKDIWNSLKVKPEWLTMEQIEAWEKEMEG